MNKNKTNWVAVLTMMFLFGMIAFVTNLAAPIGVIWKQRPGIDGSGFWGMMGNMMNFLAYLFMGLPAGRLITRLGYKKTTLIGVGVGFLGVLVQFLSGKIGVGATLAGLPANFFVYLLGAFVCGFSVCILNTVVNPMLNLLGGGGNRGNQLVQIGGTFNSTLGTLTPMLVGALIGTVTKDTAITDVNTVLYIAMGVFAVTFLILTFIPFVEPEQEKTDVSVKALLKYKHLVFGVIAIFVYVGVEVGIPGTLNFFLTDTLGTANAATTAGFVAGTYWFLMLIGRFVSSLISGKVSSRTQLAVTNAVAIALVIAAMFTTEVQASMPVFTGTGFGMAQVPLTALLLVSLRSLYFSYVGNNLQPLGRGTWQIFCTRIRSLYDNGCGWWSTSSYPECNRRRYILYGKLLGCRCSPCLYALVRTLRFKGEEGLMINI